MLKNGYTHSNGEGIYTDDIYSSHFDLFFHSQNLVTPLQDNVRVKFIIKIK
jgi:hypothetical protein